MTRKQLYWYHGRLFHIPPEECEHGTFDASPDAFDPGKIPDHPKGGHQYFNGKNLEHVGRRMFWMRDMMKEPGWEPKYLAKVKKHEKEWQNEQS